MNGLFFSKRFYTESVVIRPQNTTTSAGSKEDAVDYYLGSTKLKTNAELTVLVKGQWDHFSA